MVNFDFPNSVEHFVHRIGRTGRNGRKGHAFTLFTKAEAQMAPALVGLLKQGGQEVPSDLLDLAIEFLQKQQARS